MGLCVRKHVPHLFQGELKSSMVLNQDSASTHTSIRTLQYLDDADLKYVSPEEWIPKSPDAAPTDYSFCGISTRELQKNFIRTVADLKPILKMTWNDPTKDVIHRAIRSWPRRSRPMYYKYGSYIYHLLKLEACKLYGFNFIAKTKVKHIKLNTSCIIIYNSLNLFQDCSLLMTLYMKPMVFND